MFDLFLRLLGAPLEGAARVSETSLNFSGKSLAGWVVLGILVLGAGAVWLYRREADRLPAWRKYLLAGLRVGFLALLLGLLLRPVLSITVEGSIRRAVLFLVDGSASMKIADPRSTPEDLKRAAIAAGALDPASGLDQPLSNEQQFRNIARMDIVRGILRNAKIDLLDRLAKDFDLRAFTFGEQVEEVALSRPAGERNEAHPLVPWAEQFDAASPVTPLGDAVRDLIARSRGQSLAGVVLVTDGASNAGQLPTTAAQLAKLEGIPLYIYGVGISEPKDIIVASLLAPEVAFFDDELTANVRVRSRGLAGTETVVKLQLVTRSADGQRTVDQEIEERITLQDGEQVIPVRLTPKQKLEGETNRDSELVATIEPRPDEAAQDNNTQSQRIRIIDGRIKLLYIEQSPRWEFRYLMALLERDRRVELKAVLLEGDRSIAQGENTPYLAEIPSSREDLFKYDLIIIGDVDPKRFPSEALSRIEEFVSKFGGGVLTLAGKRFMPGAYLQTPLESMLPVEPTQQIGGNGPHGDVADKPLVLELTPAGKADTMLHLSDKPEENDRLWQSLAPIYFAAPVARAKPGAEVLIVDADIARASRFGKMPVVALQRYGLGQVLYLGTDNTWRWRRNTGEKYHAALWGQMVQRLALPHLLGESKRTQLTADRKEYSTGQRITIYARLYGTDFNPVTDPQVTGMYRSDAGASGEVQLRPLPDQPGMYRGEFTAPSAGNYEFWVSSDPGSKLEFAVTQPRIELSETAMNEQLLVEMAQTSGGAFFREESLHELPDQLKSRTELVRSSIEVELWSSPLYFLLLLAVVATEWTLRKVWQLK